LKIPESVLVVIYSLDKQVLLIERADRAGYWQSVTGSKDSVDEAWLHTAQREVHEETGIAAAAEEFEDWALENVYSIYPEWRYRYAEGVTHNTERVFGLCVPHSGPVSLAPDEHTAYVWLPWAEAMTRCTSASNAEAISHLPRKARRWI
jgi:dihydroneopterin triphosphate diphosphatase